MSQQRKWVLGIDPGYGNTGAALRLASDQDIKQAVCWSNNNVGEWDVLRAQSICIPMMERVLAWVEEYNIEELEVCIETPFLNRNPGTMIVQMYLFVLLQSYVFDYLVPIVSQVHLSIVHNATSKMKLAHKRLATKSEMIAASPWADYKKMGLTYDQAHTLADAYAHSLSAHAEQHDLTAMAQYMVEPNCEVGE